MQLVHISIAQKPFFLFASFLLLPLSTSVLLPPPFASSSFYSSFAVAFSSSPAAASFACSTFFSSCHQSNHLRPKSSPKAPKSHKHNKIEQKYFFKKKQRKKESTFYLSHSFLLSHGLLGSQRQRWKAIPKLFTYPQYQSKSLSLYLSGAGGRPPPGAPPVAPPLVTKKGPSGSWMI